MGAEVVGGWMARLCRYCSGLAGGVMGRRGEKGDGGRARLDERKGVGDIVNVRAILMVGVFASNGSANW